MYKRILLAEESDTIRGIAESLLRQSGFEVLSMTSGEKSLEVLEFTRPDLIIFASDMKYKGHTTMLEQLQREPKSANLPFLVMTTEQDGDLQLPPEITIKKPFDPKEFINRVNLLSGAANASGSDEKINPLAAGVEEELLDAALGLDQIDVTDSEVLNQSLTNIKIKQNPSEKMIGYDHQDDITNVGSDSGKVESLMIRDEDGEIKAEGNVPKKNQMQGTGKLEILEDQFGLLDTNLPDTSNTDSDHDYNWFLNELKTEGTAKGKQPSKELSNSQKLSFEENSSVVDPITLSPKTKQKQVKTSGSGVDKFIDEFKKEVEKFSQEETESITLSDDSISDKNPETSYSWQDTIESITPEQIEIFKKQFVSELAEKLAEKIVAKIDGDKLIVMLKQEIIKRSKKS